jgi:membrane associated rhomboid family serine protease
MLEDRDYMRQPEYHDSSGRGPFRPRWSWTVILLAVYVLVFLANQIADHFFPGNHFFRAQPVLTESGVGFLPGYLPLSAEGLERGYLWQLLTYQFLHSGWMHLFLNGWAIYVFGRELEHFIGGRKFLALVLSSGIVGGVLQVLVAVIWPGYFGGDVVGASAGAFGLIAAYALMFPDRELQLLLFFVIPVRLRARTLLIGLAAIALVGFSFPKLMPGVAHAAHLGGMAMGWFFVRKIMQGDWSRLGGVLRPFKKVKSPRARPDKAEEKSTADFMESEVDPILDKISAHGIQSLTAREREILEAARKQVRRP